MTESERKLIVEGLKLLKKYVHVHHLESAHEDELEDDMGALKEIINQIEAGGENE